MPIATHTCKVIKNDKISEDCYHLELTRPKELQFKAGQYYSIAVFNQEKKKWTPYSILSHPDQFEDLAICYKLIPEGHSTPILIQAKPGDSFDLKGPLGTFIFKEDSPHKTHWFIGTGTGVAPLYSMIKQYKDKLNDHSFRLFFGSRNVSNLVYHEEFVEWEKSNDNVTYTPTCTREDWEGCQGRVQEHFGDDLKNKDFYICGLKDMVLDTVKYLEEQGAAKEDIHFERYT